MDDRPDDDFWVIPLHGAIVPVPPSADVTPPAPPSAPTPPVPVSDGYVGEPLTLLPDPDELPTDDGYHPRLRRAG